MSNMRQLNLFTLRGPSAVEMAGLPDNARYSVTILDEPAQVLSGMERGIPDFAVLPSPMGAILHEKGIPYSILCTTIRGGLFLCGIPNPGAILPNTLPELKGSTIRTLGSVSPPEQLLRRVLALSGLAPDSDVLFEHSLSTHRKLSDAALRGEAGLYLLSEPFVSIALASPGSRLRILMDLGDECLKAEGRRPAIASLFCKDSLKGTRAAQQVVSDLKLSCEWVKANPAQAVRKVISRGIFQDSAAEALETSIPRSGFEIVDNLL